MTSLRTPEQFRTFFRGEPAPGERKVFTVRGADFPMRWIPAGRFLMGAGADDAEAFEHEKPQREVTITQGFWIGETPVTQGQYRAIMGYNPSRMKEISINAPVETVSWHEAVDFAKRVDCRLPTEAEWEYACRAGTTTPRYGALDDIARYLDDNGDHTRLRMKRLPISLVYYRDNSGGHTHPVGMTQPNPWGLCDMLGNVWEWTMDTYKNSYAGMGMRGRLRTDVGTNGSGEEANVIRGGSWGSRINAVRSASRSSAASAHGLSTIGFRLAKSAGNSE